MGTWSFSPSLDERITTAETGGKLVITVPPNVFTTDKEYTVTYDDGNGCTANATFYIKEDCGGGGGGGSKEIVITPKTLNKDDNGEVQIAHIDSVGEECTGSLWEVTIDGDFLTNPRVQGEYIYANVTPNGDDNPRHANVTVRKFSSGDMEGCSKTFTVTQNGTSCEIDIVGMGTDLPADGSGDELVQIGTIINSCGVTEWEVGDNPANIVKQNSIVVIGEKVFGKINKNQGSRRSEYVDLKSSSTDATCSRCHDEFTVSQAGSSTPSTDAEQMLSEVCCSDTPKSSSGNGDTVTITLINTSSCDFLWNGRIKLNNGGSSNYYFLYREPTQLYCHPAGCGAHMAYGTNTNYVFRSSSGGVSHLNVPSHNVIEGRISFKCAISRNTPCSNAIGCSYDSIQNINGVTIGTDCSQHEIDCSYLKVGGDKFYGSLPQKTLITSVKKYISDVEQGDLKIVPNSEFRITVGAGGSTSYKMNQDNIDEIKHLGEEKSYLYHIRNKGTSSEEHMIIPLNANKWYTGTPCGGN